MHDPEATPARLGYRMPAEWEPHEATWLAWPHNRDDWPGKFAPVPWVYAEIVRLLSAVEHVNILVKGRKMKRRAADTLDAAGVDLERVTFVKAATDRVWMRDTGPTFVVNTHAETPSERVALIDWKFNGWAKYNNYKHDERVPAIVEKHLEFRRFEPTAEIDGETVRRGAGGGRD